MRRLPAAIAALLSLLPPAARAQPIATPLAPPLATPVGAVEGIARALDARPLVVVGERAGWEQQRAFLLALVRDARVAERVDDVVVECGSARYQPLADRYVRGEAVPRAELRRIWRSTATISLEAPSICGGVFDAVRAVNAGRAPTRRLRVLLAQPPIDWGEVTRATRLDSVPRPDEFYATLVKAEVLDRGRRALLVVGTGNALRRSSSGGRLTVVQRLEAAAPGSAYVVVPFDGFGDPAPLRALDARLAGWPAPSLATLRGTPLGATDASTLYAVDVHRLVDGRMVDEMVRLFRGIPLAELADALLYLGPRASMRRTLPTAAERGDAAFVAELDRRSRLQFGEPFRPPRAGAARLHPDATPPPNRVSKP